MKQREDLAKTGKQLISAFPDFLAALLRAPKPQHDQWIATANSKGKDGKAAYDYFVVQVNTAPR